MAIAEKKYDRDDYNEMRKAAQGVRSKGVK